MHPVLLLWIFWDLTLSEVRIKSPEPLHKFGEHPTWQQCCGPSGSIFLLRLRRPEDSHSAGFVIISSKRVVKPLSSRIVEMKTELALERHRKVVFPPSFSFLTALTIAGCCVNYIVSLAWNTGKEDTNIRHDSKCVKDLVLRDTSGVCFSERLSTSSIRESTSKRRCARKTYTRSVHWISFLRVFIFRRRSGARTSKIHLSVSWSAIDLLEEMNSCENKSVFLKSVPVKVKDNKLLSDIRHGIEIRKSWGRSIIANL